MWTTHGSSATKMRKHDRLQKLPDKEEVEGIRLRLGSVLRARQESQERYLAGTHGQSEMPPDLRRGGQRGVTVQFPN
jgi:hypothetical protein